MHYDDEDHDPYAPRTRPAAMPSPRSKFAPYFSRCTDTLEDFLEEFEGLAYDCALTDPQRVDVIICYVDPSLRDFWRSLSGYHSRDWHLFRQSLVNIFGNTTPRHQVMRQKLHSCIQETSRTRMHCEDDVLRYYRQFICFGLPLVHSGHLTKEDRNAAFWCGFHPEDRKVLQPRLLSKNSFQPSDIPFHFEDVLSCARAAFAYDDYFPSPRSHAKQFEPSSVVRCEQPVVRPIPRDAYSSRAVTRGVATYAETTPSFHTTPDTQHPSLISPLASESQHTQAHSVTLDQPETAYTLSSTLLPSASPSPIYTHSLAPSAAADVPEISSTPLPSPTLAPFSMPISSDFEHLPLTPVDQPEPTLSSQVSSTPPSSSSISPTFVPSATEDQSEPEPAPALFASVPTLPFTSSHVHSAINNFASTPPSSSSTSSTCLPSVTEEQPEPIPSITPASTFVLTPPSSSTFLPSSVSMRSAMNSQPEYEPEHAPLSLITPTSPSLPAPSLALEFTDDVRALSSLPLPETSTLDSLPLILSLDQSSSSGSLSQLSSPCEFESTPVPVVDFAPPNSESPEFFEPESSQGEPIPFFLASPEAPPIAHISPRSTPLQRPPGLETIGSVSTQLEVTPSPASPTVSPIPQQVTTAQWLLYLDPRLPERQERQEVSLAYEVSSNKPPALTPRPSLFRSLGSLRRTPARFGFALALVTTAILSSLLNVSATTSTLASKFWSKKEDFGGSQNGAFKTYKPCNISAQHLRPGQLTPRDPRLVFDPGGQASSSSFQPSAREDIRQRKTTTRSGCTTLNASIHSHSNSRQTHLGPSRPYTVVEVAMLMSSMYARMMVPLSSNNSMSSLRM